MALSLMSGSGVSTGLSFKSLPPPPRCHTSDLHSFPCKTTRTLLMLIECHSVLWWHYRVDRPTYVAMLDWIKLNWMTSLRALRCVGAQVCYLTEPVEWSLGFPCYWHRLFTSSVAGRKRKKEEKKNKLLGWLISFRHLISEITAQLRELWEAKRAAHHKLTQRSERVEMTQQSHQDNAFPPRPPGILEEWGVGEWGGLGEEWGCQQPISTRQESYCNITFYQLELINLNGVGPTIMAEH